MSGPYPEEIQLLILRTMRGLENVEIVRPGENKSKCIS
jgi:tRNA U34 5-carboxymethylaminomethyl modifying enzyme MnmG/GidA